MRTLVAIPAFNCRDAIASSLESCARQTAPCDVFVVDNCSTDDTPAIAERFVRRDGRFRLFVNERNLGRVGNWNRCLELLAEHGHDVIHLLFAGDTLEPECVARARQAFAEHPRAGAVFWPYAFIRDGETTVTRVFEGSRYIPPAELDELNILGGSILGAIVCNAYSREAIGDVRFNEAFVGKHDFDLRILRGRGAVYLTEVLSRFHVEHHRTFASAEHNFRVQLEACLNRAAALEAMKPELPALRYKELRAAIIADAVRQNLQYMETRDLMELSRRAAATIASRAARRIQRSEPRP